MTWSILARDEATGRIGIIVAGGAFALGGRVPHLKTGVGAVATQGFTNPLLGPRGLALLGAGGVADDCVRMLMLADDGRELRQLHVMDRSGRMAAHTGRACAGWCGHDIHDTFSVAGTHLPGPAVIAATIAGYEAARSLPFARRLLAAMQAGQAAGGDTRGTQSAALLIHDEQDYGALDLRVDDHAAPLAELARLEGKARERWVHARRFLPAREAPAGLLDTTQLEAGIARSISENYE